MTTTAHAARLPLTEAVAARLETLGPGRLTVYPDGEVPGAPPALSVDGVRDPSGRVAPYAVVFGGAGRLDVNPSMEATPTDSVWPVGVTFAAGFAKDLLAVLDDAVPLLHLWVPQVDGITCGPLRPLDGFDPGQVRRDTKKKPPRFFLATQWRLHVTTS